MRENRENAINLRQKTVPTLKLKPGMKLADNVKNEYGGILVPAGTILNEKFIELLDRHGIKSVTVEKESKEKRSDNIKKIEEIKEKYQEASDESRNLFSKTRQQRKIDTDQLVKMFYKVKDLQEKEGAQQELVNLFSTIQDPDNYLYHHSLDVSILASMFADWLGMKDGDKKQLIMAGLLHDIGKIEVPYDILNKEDALTPGEFAEVKKHAHEGYKIAKECPVLKEKAVQGILTHHQCCDGSGYPLKLQGHNIPLYGRILAIIDVYDAAVSKTVYNDEKPSFKVIKHLSQEQANSFDEELCDIFRENMVGFHSEARVKLDNGKVGRVIYDPPNKPEQKIVETAGKFINLFTSEREIVQVISNN
ncbi:HD-GYP domain-containing protein [Halarsenatibacter silvermanii]|uniref:HDIG domain-containing protein n=1 Tax=Halarsenatibacter silvermanii TaxID=321763 RepID=A0A1G9S4I0_9FIRM|nr:HD-GYP domain-containing protein [Halarsenatibacter silvermanii]SDM29655.1 HDIG domain-containing protein [Halarsenatibacter silvermanii]